MEKVKLEENMSVDLKVAPEMNPEFKLLNEKVAPEMKFYA